MPQHDIEITILKTGEVKVHVKGAKGKACLAYTKLLTDIVGTVKQQQFTSEYYEPDQKVQLNVQQKNEQA